MGAPQSISGTPHRTGLGRLLAIAALGLGWAAGAQAAPDAVREAARATPRAAPPPAVLSAADAQRMRRAFEAQARGDIEAAAELAAQTHDRRLIGHLLADRYLRLPEAAAAADLQTWLADHADHPDAPRLHALLARRLPRGAALPPPPGEPAMPLVEATPEERAAGPVLVRQPALDRAVRERLAEGRHADALGLVQRAGLLAPAYAAQLRAEVAQSMFRAGHDEAALRTAHEALRTAPNAAAAFAGGLAAWSLTRYEEALRLFETAARAEAEAPAFRAAAAFWTARAAVRARRPQAYVGWMLLAAQEPRTFHGLLARRSLGLPNGFAWESPQPDTATLAETAAGWRAMALVQVGQRERAEAELRLLWRRGRGNPMLTQAILALAAQAGMPALAAQVGTAAQSADGRPRDFARFPLPVMVPSGGFRVDPALLYALALQESRFDPAAISRSGARGLLQVMPATASYVANDPSLRGAGAQRLHEPAFGLEIGQRYVHYLARHDAVGGDLIRLLAAYNAGPGNLSRWLPATRHRDDPLLFIESIPIAETRAFVQRVLAFQWIYASRLGLPSPSLDTLAAGSFPRFATTEEVTAMLRATTIRTARVN